MRSDLLFYEGDLHATLQSQGKKVQLKVDNIPKEQFLVSSDDQIINSIASETEVNPIVIFEDRKSMRQSESRLDVSNDRNRNIFNESGPIYVAGTSIEISIPFSGDPLLWRCKPDSFRSVWPRGTVESSRGNELGILKLSFDIPADEAPENLKNRVERE